VDLEDHALGLEVHLGLDVVHVPLEAGVPRLSGERGLAQGERRATLGLVDEVDAGHLTRRRQAQLVGVEGPRPAEVRRGDVGLDPAGVQHGSLPIGICPRRD